MFLLTLIVGGPALASDADSLAASLASLRSDVETLATELSLQKEDLRNRLRAMDAEKADLSVRVRQEELRLEQLQQAVDAQVEARAATSEADEALRPVVVQGVATFRTTVEDSLPFRKGERLAELDEIERALASGERTPRESASRLWSFSEDELRLSKENALDRQVIELDGQEVLVDVARLGMVALYWRTDDGRLGKAEKTASGWAWVEYTDQADIVATAELFDALEKQIRTGFFELPAGFGSVQR